MDRGIKRELGQLSDWANHFSGSTLPGRYTWVLWSDGLARASLHSLGVLPPAPRAHSRLIAPTVLLLSVVMPAEAASAFLIHTIDGKSGRSVSGVKVQSNGHLLGLTDPKGELKADTSEKKIRLSKDGYQTLELPSNQLLEENLLVLTPLPQKKTMFPATPAPKLTPAAKPTHVPTLKPIVVPTKMPTQVPTMKPVSAPTKKATHIPTLKPIVVSTPKPSVKQAAKPIEKPKPPVQVSTPAPSLRPTARPSVAPAPIAREVHRHEAAKMGNAYTVRPGDSLYLIAWRLLGNAERWQEIYHLNQGQIANPHRIFPGQRLVLPQERPQSYRVVQGDTLWDVARRHLGDGNRWKEIYQLNRPLIPNPHWILPDQELLLPRR